MLNIPTIDTKSIEQAVNRLMDFNSVNQTRRDKLERLEGLKLYCESIGLDEEGVMCLFNAVEGMFGEDQASAAFLGVLIGLAIPEYQE